MTQFPERDPVGGTEIRSGSHLEVQERDLSAKAAAHLKAFLTSISVVITVRRAAASAWALLSFTRAIAEALRLCFFAASSSCSRSQRATPISTCPCAVYTSVRLTPESDSVSSRTWFEWPVPRDLTIVKARLRSPSFTT